MAKDRKADQAVNINHIYMGMGNVDLVGNEMSGRGLMGVVGKN